jgi:chemotaxis protein CheD
VPLLVAEMSALGARAGRITGRLVGGASMFANLLASGGMNIGDRNVEAARAALALAGVPLLGEDVGGEHGRSVYFHVHDGRLEIRSLRRGNREL